MSDATPETPALDDLPLDADEQVGDEVEPEHDLDIEAIDAEEAE